MGESTKRRITVLLDEEEFSRLRELADARTGGKQSTALALALALAYRVLLDPSTVRTADANAALDAFCAGRGTE